MNHTPQPKLAPAWRWASHVAVTLALSACGGGGDGAPGSAGALGTSGAADKNQASGSAPGLVVANCSAVGIPMPTESDMDARSWPNQSDIETSTTTCSNATGLAGDAEAPGISRPAGTEPARDAANYSAKRGPAQTDLGDTDPAVLEEAAQAQASAGIFPIARSWRMARLIDTNPGAADNPQVAANAGGAAFSVWHQFDGVRNNIWASRYATGATSNTSAAGIGWRAPVLVETNNAGSAKLAQIAVDNGGNAVAVWEQYDGLDFSIWASRYAANTDSWSSAVRLQTAGAKSGVNPQIAVDTSGNALAVWTQLTGRRANVFANRYTAGVGWGTAAAIESNTGDAEAAQVAFDGNGNALAVWGKRESDRSRIWFNRYTPGTGWSAAQPIGASIAGYQVRPRLSVNASGDAIALWERSGNFPGQHVMASRYAAGAGWGPSAVIHGNLSGIVENPQISLDASGNATAVWSQWVEGDSNIWSNRFSAGLGWGAARLIQSPSALLSFSPQIAQDARGNALAVWQQSDGTRFNIWSNRYSARTGWGLAARIETDNTGYANYPQVAMDAKGNGFAVWSQDDGTRTNIWGNSFR